MLKLWVKAHNALYTIRESEKGQTMAEYGVVLAVITLGVIVALGLLSGAIQAAFNKVQSTINPA